MTPGEFETLAGKVQRGEIAHIGGRAVMTGKSGDWLILQCLEHGAEAVGRELDMTAAQIDALISEFRELDCGEIVTERRA